jgi:hypothetical protein
MYTCKTCGTTDSSLFYTKTKYYCKSCWNQKTYKASRDKLDQLIQERGGKCEQCGYDKCKEALQWHHTDPSKKEFAISAQRGRNIDQLRTEVSKCQLLCANCHCEAHVTMRPNPTAKN